MTLSIIIVNYNVKYFLEQCLCSVRKALEFTPLSEGESEVLVVDNNSADGSIEYLQPRFPFVRFIANKENIGYARANNQGLKEAHGKYVLFLNPDTILPEDIFRKTISFMDQHPDAGAIGVRMIDGSGRFLKESKRGLPTAWASFCKMSGLTGLFPSSKAFAGYYMGHLDEKVTQEVEVLAGAFLMARHDILKTIDGFDERFFMYAEDIDLSYRIMQAGYKNYYLADAMIIHFKGESTRKDAKYVKQFYKAMRQFVEKHYKDGAGKFSSLLLNGAISFRTAIAIMGGSNNKQETMLPKDVAVQGDKNTVDGLVKWLQDNSIRIRSASSSFKFDGNAHLEGGNGVCILAEGRTCSFAEIIKAIQLLSPSQKGIIHASGSDSIVGSFDKDGQGISIGLGTN